MVLRAKRIWHLPVLCGLLVGCMEARQSPDQLQAALVAAQDGGPFGDTAGGKDSSESETGQLGDGLEPGTDAESELDADPGTDAEPEDVDDAEPDSEQDGESDAGTDEEPDVDEEPDLAVDTEETGGDDWEISTEPDTETDSGADLADASNNDATSETISDVTLDVAKDIPEIAEIAPCDPKNCDDGNPCSVDTCSKLGSCDNNPVADGQACTTPAGSGSCNTGVCFISTKCGNGEVEKPAVKPELCDDGGVQDGDGCSAKCLWECGSLALSAGGSLAIGWQPGLVLQSGDFTVEAMVRPSNASGDQALVALRPPKGTGAGWSFGIYGGLLSFRSGGGTTAAGYVSASIAAPGVVAGKWQHFAAGYQAQGKTLRLWRNGKLIAEKANFAAPGFSDAPLRIGQEDETGYAPFAGDVGFVRISAVQRYAAPFTTPLSVPSDTKTLLHLAMQGNAQDLTGNSSPGQSIGPAVWAQMAPGCSPGSACGDAQTADWEGCDDGNTQYGDGCDSQCQKESPPLGGLRDAAMAYDSASDVGWLVGGEGAYALNDIVWRFTTSQKSATWQAFAGLIGPAARARTGLTRDPATGHAWLFGGQGYYTLYDDLWKLVPAQQGPPAWQQVASSGPRPSPRHGHVQFWDGGRLVIGLGEGHYQLLDDWWAFDPKGGSWTLLSAPAQSKPGPRRFAALAADAQGGAWLVGGQGYYKLYAEVLKVGVAGNSLVVAPVPLGGGAPPALLGSCALANDGKLLVLGGETYYDLPGQAWLYDGTKWSGLAAPRKVGGVCLRRGDGKALLQLGQGFYQMSDPPWLGPGL